MNKSKSWNELSEPERKLRLLIICTMIASASMVAMFAKTVYYFIPPTTGDLSNLIISDVLLGIMGVSAIYFADKNNPIDT